MAIQYNGVERGIYVDTYNFLLKYINSTKETMNWENAVKDVKEINEKYRYHPMCTQMVALCLNQLEYKFGGRKLADKTYEQWEEEINGKR